MSFKPILISSKNPVCNSKGQTLIEYLIIIALVGVGSIALMRVVSQNINYRFSKVVEALGGHVDSGAGAAAVSSTMTRTRDMRDFARGAVESKKSHSNESN